MNRKIIKCSCNHEYQDAKYGLKMRVHNRLQGAKTSGYRCTICKLVKPDK